MRKIELTCNWNDLVAKYKTLVPADEKYQGTRTGSQYIRFLRVFESGRLVWNH